MDQLGDLTYFKHCALVPTRNKVCTIKGWQHTTPDPEHFEEEWPQLLARGFEPAATLRTSGLIGFEADGLEDRHRLFETLRRHEIKPWLFERRRDDPTRVHVYVRQPRSADVLPKVSFRFEAGGLIAALNNYFRVSYEGGPYQVTACSEGAPPMTAEAYAGLLAEAKVAHEETRTARREGSPLAEGSRRNEVFRFGCFLSRWTDDYDLACEIADTWQATFCDPPIPRSWTDKQVQGAWVVAENEGRLACEVFRNVTRRVQVGNFAHALAAWCGDDRNLIAELAEMWAAA